MTEQVLQIELTDKANEAAAYIVGHNLSGNEAGPKLRALGFSAEDIKLALAFIGLVKAEEEQDFRTAAAKLRAEPEPEPQRTKVREPWRRNFAEEAKQRTEEKIFSAPAQPEEVRQPEGEPEIVEEPNSELLEELEADVAEHRRRKLWRVESALKHLGPKGFDPRKAGAVIWRLTEGSPQGRAVFEDWLGEGAHDLWAKGFGKVWCGVEEVYRAAISRGGWRYRVVLSPNRLNQVAEQSEKAMVRARVEIFQAASELVRPVRIEVEATK
jgi:hypothetical protein